jgi:hypothetical protein
LSAWLAGPRSCESRIAAVRICNQSLPCGPDLRLYLSEILTDLPVSSPNPVRRTCRSGRDGARNAAPGMARTGTAIAICNKCGWPVAGVFATLDPVLQRIRRCSCGGQIERAARRTEVKKLVPFIAAAALGLGVASAAEAHVSIGVGIGLPIAPAYPVYAAPPPVVYAPPPPVVYAPAPAYYGPPPVVYGGGYYGRPYWHHYHHGYYGRHW